MECQFCKETIRDDATVCKHCGATAKHDRSGRITWHARGSLGPRLARRVIVGVVVVAVAALLVFQYNRAQERAKDKADREYECEVLREC